MDQAGSEIQLPVILIALALVGATVALPALATHDEPENGLPADRVSVAGSSLEVMTSSVSNGSVSEVHEVLHTQLRTSTPADLILSVTAECALWTDVTTVGNDDQQAIASVKVWVEIDGERVDVDGAASDDGEAVFCNRAYRVATLQFDDEDATIERYLSTRSANAFTWVAEDVGSGTDNVHDVVVKAQLEGEATNNANAKAAIGSRTLVIQPTFLVSNDGA